MTVQEAASLMIELLRNIASAVAPRRPVRIVHGGTSANGDWQTENQVVQRPCRLRYAVCSNKGGSDLWLWVIDSTCGSGETKPTCAPVYVPSLSSQSINVELSPREMRHGIYVCVSTDPVTKTSPVTNDAFFDVAYDFEVY